MKKRYSKLPSILVPTFFVDAPCPLQHTHTKHDQVENVGMLSSNIYAPKALYGGYGHLTETEF